MHTRCPSLVTILRLMRILLHYWGDISPCTKPWVCTFLVEDTPMTPRSQSSTPIPPLPAGATSLSEQSAPGASQGIDARGWAASDRIEKAAAEASTFADLQPPTHLSSHVRPSPRPTYWLANGLTELDDPTGSPPRRAYSRSRLLRNRSRFSVPPASHATSASVSLPPSTPRWQFN